MLFVEEKINIPKFSRYEYELVSRPLSSLHSIAFLLSFTCDNYFIEKYIIVDGVKYCKYQYVNTNIDNLPVAKIICKLEKI